MIVCFSRVTVATTSIVIVFLILFIFPVITQADNRAVLYYVTNIEGAQLYAEPNQNNGYTYEDMTDKQQKWLRVGLGHYVYQTKPPAQAGSGVNSKEWLYVSTPPITEPLLDRVDGWIHRQDIIEKSKLVKTRNIKPTSWNIAYYCQFKEGGAYGSSYVTELVFTQNGKVNIFQEKVKQGFGDIFGGAMNAEESKPARQQTSGRYIVSGNLLIIHHDKPQTKFDVYGYAKGQIVPVSIGTLYGASTKFPITATQVVVGRKANLDGELGNYCKAAPRE